MYVYMSIIEVILMCMYVCVYMSIIEVILMCVYVCVYMSIIEVILMCMYVCVYMSIIEVILMCVYVCVYYRGDIDGALSMIDEYSSLPPHVSSLVLAMQLAVDRDKSSEVVKMRDIMRTVVGDNTTDNVMFFSLIKANQISQAQQILQV